VKVGLVSPYDLGRFGGVQDQVLQLASWLRDAGHTTVVVGPGTGPAGTVSLGPARVITVNGAAAPIRLDPRMAGQIATAVADCDVVHVHEPLMPMVGLSAGRARGPALVGTFHADPSKPVRTAYRIGAPMVRRMLSRYDVITAVSPVAASAIRTVAEPILVPNGVAVDTYTPAGGNPLRVAFLGRDDPRKGLDVLLEAWPDVHRTVPGAELVVAAGDRSEDLPGATFAGRVDETEKRALLADAGVFCAPNTGGESFGIVLVEAMASRCAIVASGLAAFVHVLGDAAALVKPGDAAGLAQTLVRLLRDPDAIAELQGRALERAGRYDREAVLTAYLGVYRRAIERHGARLTG